MYAIYNRQRGYMCVDEDAMNEIGYDFDIDEFTIMFDSVETAELNRGLGERVVELTDCPECDRKSKPDTASSHTNTLDGATYFKTFVMYCPRCLRVIDTSARL